MKTLEQRIVRVTVPTPSRATKEERPGDEASRINFYLDGGYYADGTPRLFDLDGNETTPPDDGSTLVVINLGSGHAGL